MKLFFLMIYKYMEAITREHEKKIEEKKEEVEKPKNYNTIEKKRKKKKH